MEDEKQFTPAPFATFADSQSIPPQAPTSTATDNPSASRKRRSRRSKNVAAAPSPASPAKPKRKYTRRTAAVAPTPQPGTSAAARTTMAALSELDVVVQIVDIVKGFDAKTKARILAAVQRFS